LPHFILTQRQSAEFKRKPFPINSGRGLFEPQLLAQFGGILITHLARLTLFSVSFQILVSYSLLSSFYFQTSILFKGYFGNA
jgi:hypothetical protein